MTLTDHSAVSMSPMFGILLASSGGLFILFLTVLFSFIRWLKKQSEETPNDDWLPKPGKPSQRPTTVSQPRTTSQTRQWPQKTTNWEEALRKALEKAGTTAPPPIPNRPAPPAQPTPSQQPPTMSVPTVFQKPKYYKAHCNNCDQHIEYPASASGQVIACPHCHRPTVLRPFEQTRVETISHEDRLTKLSESQTRYDTASRLSGKVESEMEQTVTQPATATSVEEFQRRSEEIQAVVDLLRRPQTARQAILASVILGPPKALEG